MFLDYIQNVVDEFDCVDQVVAVNRLIEQFFVSRFPSERERIHFIERGVAAPVSRNRLRANALRVGFVGRLEHASKRVLDMAELCPFLSRPDAPIELHIYGDGVDRAELQRRVGEPARPRVFFHGYKTTSELYQTVYPSLDAILLFSPSEGSPTVIYEAMHHGVVPIMSRYLGHACDGVVRPGRNGLTFAVGDMKAAAGHILELAADPGRLGRLGRQAAQDMSGHVEGNMHEVWERLLTASLSLPPRPAARSLPPAARPAGEGRLNKIIPVSAANRLRRLFGKPFPHGGGFEEWPGSQPASPCDIDHLTRSLQTLEDDAAARLYGPEVSLDGLAPCVN
jgi:glycosyltransferase involved in cell wall biosynthesis